MGKITVKTKHGEYVIGGIYRHYKGNFYKLVEVAFLHLSQDIFLIIYHQCDENGVFKSIRDEKDVEKTIPQPFATHETRWNDTVIITADSQIKRFTLIK